MKRILSMLPALVCCAVLYAQPSYPVASPVPNLAKAEYFFDTDPGFGNGTPVTLNAVQNINALQQTLLLSGSALSNGVHRLYIRTQDAQGQWSFTASSVFDNFIVPVYPVAAAQSVITATEYFIDTDPGMGNAMPLTITPGADLNNLQLAVNISGLSAGTHRLYIRSKDNTGKWSFVGYALLDNSAAVPYPNAPPAPAALSELEYFINTDPGLGKATAVSLPVTTEVTNFQFSVPVAALSQGAHTVYVRSKNNPYSFTAYVQFTKGVALPLTWLYVKGEVRGDEHLVSWGTAAESNVSHFEIEHSTDGEHYKVIGKVNAGELYRFIHKQPSAGWNHYRVVEHDHDGYTSRSKVITLLNTSKLNRTLITPNPFVDHLRIAVAPQETARRIIVYSTNGRQMMEQPVNSSFIELATGSLPGGTYFVKIIYSNKEATYKVIRK